MFYPVHRVSIYVICLLLLTGLRVYAEPTCKESAGTIVSLQGKVEAISASDTDWHPVKADEILCPNGKVRTLGKSRAVVQLRNGTVLRLDHWSTVRLQPEQAGKQTLLEQLKGKILFFNRFPRRLTINTPFANASSEGTEFLVVVDQKNNLTSAMVLEGTIVMANNAGRLRISDGQAASAKAGEAPSRLISVHPIDSIQWALYYPPTLAIGDISALEKVGDRTLREMLKQSISLFHQGNFHQALLVLEEPSGQIQEPILYTYRASLFLSVGRTEEARAEIDKGLAVAPQDGHALALLAIMAIVQNDKAKALQLAQEADRAAPESASVKIVLSYVHQANNQPADALEAAKAATRLDPTSGLARARLAELWLTRGELDKALCSAEEAVLLNPHEAHALMVFGFAELLQCNLDASRKAFQQAISLAPSDPLARLGHGLADIRDGQLEKGRQQLEIAASLDPANALIRSYLGKGYFEEGRYDLAGIQFDLAKKLDPLDPTPYLYDAIRKQSDNRPVEARQDLRMSMQLNDNRAVYRSRLLLDSDLAARSISLAKINQDLGFQQMALLEGWQSVNTDPSNHSAHRYLSDSYAALPHAEISRLSELLVSQLLQPVNNTPVQPRLGEKAPAILAGAGPTQAAFNEFNQLFNRDRFRFYASAIAGEHDTVGDEFIHTGLYKKTSYSLGRFHHETDGYRTNSDLEENAYNLFAQVNISHKTSVQAEYRSDDTETGDIDLRFDPTNYSPTLRRKGDTETFRLGFHHALSTRSDILFSFFHQDFDEQVIDLSPVASGLPPGASIKATSDQTGNNGEVQFIHRRESSALLIGGGLYRGDEATGVTVELGFPVPPIILLSDSEIRYHNVYAYKLVDIFPKLRLTIGASVDLYKGTPEDEERFNPKLGIIWQPFPTTTVRMAGFSAFKRPLISNQTIEPTQVAGFQQFYDDPDASHYRRYGIGIDQTLSPALFGGVEFVKRDIDVPYVSSASPDNVSEVEKDERLARAYLYWTPAKWLAASAEYYYEHLDSDDRTAPFGGRVTTKSVPLGLNLFYAGRIFVKSKMTYVEQDGVFDDVASGNLIPGSDNFWIADFSAGYRLAKNRGIFSLEVKNLFDKSFKFNETDQVNTLYQPGRVALIRLTLSL